MGRDGDLGSVRDMGATVNILSRNNPTSKSALMGLAIFCASVGFVLVGKMTSADWVDLMKFAIPSFLAAETARKWAPTVAPPTPGA